MRFYKPNCYLLFGSRTVLHCRREEGVQRRRCLEQITKFSQAGAVFLLNSPCCVLQLVDEESVTLPFLLLVGLGWEEVNYLRPTMNYLNYHIHRRCDENNAGSYERLIPVSTRMHFCKYFKDRDREREL